MSTYTRLVFQYKCLTVGSRCWRPSQACSGNREMCIRRIKAIEQRLENRKHIFIKLSRYNMLVRSLYIYFLQMTYLVYMKAMM